MWSFIACHNMPRICRRSPLDPALTMRFGKKTQQHTSKVLRLPRKMTMEVSKVLRPSRKSSSSSENDAKVLRLPHKTMLDTFWNMLECHKVPRLPNETRLRDVWSKSDRSCRTRHKHGHMALTRTVANGCGRLRNVWRTRPQPTPRPPEWNGNPCYASGNNDIEKDDKLFKYTNYHFRLPMVAIPILVVFKPARFKALGRHSHFKL